MAAILDAFCDPVGELVLKISGGMIPDDQAKYLFCLIIAYPLAYMYNVIGSPNLKHIYGTLIGLFFGYFTIKQQVWFSIVSTVIGYILLVITPRQHVHKVLYIFGIGFLAGGHIYRLYVDYLGWSMDFSGIQMIITLKFITLGFDYYDGEEKNASEEVFKKYPNRKKMMVKDKPTFLEYFGYMYFFPGYLSGPAFNFIEYKNFTDGNFFPPNTVVPSPVGPALLKFANAILLLVGVFASMYIPVSFARTEEFYNLSFLHRMFYLWASVGLSRFPYYFAWFLSEGSLVLSGIGYNGKGGWDRATNVRILGVELSQNIHGITENWNIRVNSWLKHYVYERVPKYQTALTFLNSAFWHGFYPGYYLSFMSAAFFQNVAKTMRTTFRSYFVITDKATRTEKPGPYHAYKKVYDVLTLIATHYSLNYVMAPFVILSFEHSWRAWKSLYFIGHIFVFVAWVMGKFVVRPYREKGEKKA